MIGCAHLDRDGDCSILVERVPLIGRGREPVGDRKEGK